MLSNCLANYLLAVSEIVLICRNDNKFYILTSHDIEAKKKWKETYSIEIYIVYHNCIQLHSSLVATTSHDYRYWYKLAITTRWQGNSHGFDIPLASRAINLPGVAANVVDIQDSKCEGRVNVTGEGSVSKRTMRYPSGRLGLPRDEGKPGIARVRPGSSPCEPQRITERVTVRTFAGHCSPRQIEPSFQTFALTHVRQKKKRLSPACRRFTSLSALSRDGTRLISGR